MSRRFGLGVAMFLGFYLCIQTGGYAQVPVSVLLNNVREPVNFIVGYSPVWGSYQEVSSGAHDFGSSSDVISARATQCVKAIDAALAADVPASRTIEIKFRDGARTIPLSEIQAICQRMSGTAGKATALREAKQPIMRADFYSKKISKGEDISGVYAKVAADDANKCISAIDKALASTHPGSTVIELTGDDKTTLSDAREMCVYVLNAATKQVKTDVAAEEATYAPFRKLLSGDKLNLYNKWKNRKIYTTGGRLLSTPESYRDATVWCSVGVNRSGIVPAWDMECSRFKGMTQVGGPIKKNGTGDEPPSSAFP